MSSFIKKIPLISQIPYQRYINLMLDIRLAAVNGYYFASIRYFVYFRQKFLIMIHPFELNSLFRLKHFKVQKQIFCRSENILTYKTVIVIDSNHELICPVTNM